jgi:transposase
VSLDDAVDPENEVRLIDLFVDNLNLTDFGFKFEFIENGRPAYHPGDLLKLFIYGYLNKIRSSRALEKETKRNIELMWLLKQLQPDPIIIRSPIFGAITLKPSRMYSVRRYELQNTLILLVAN